MSDISIASCGRVTRSEFDYADAWGTRQSGLRLRLHLTFPHGKSLHFCICLKAMDLQSTSGPTL